ncbi:MAG: peroxiredoxin [Deltaproteobacteria bacterium]|nr:peroxiredoxin [Deltaproteobacteria bacterium]
MKKVKEGAKAPAFELCDKDGTKHALKSMKEKYVVLYFYPKDDTPGCTLEAKEFTADLKKYSKLKAAVIGVSGGDEKTKTKFCKKHDLDVLLLSDPDFEVAKAYESYGQKTFMGRKYMGILRNTFVLDAKRKILKVFSAVKPEGHSAEVLAYLKSL